MLSVGQIVYAKNGRDKGRFFIIILMDSEYVYLADGSTRRLSKPKKKKAKHIQKTNTVSISLKEKLEMNSYLLDADIRNELLRYARGKGENE